MCTCKKREGLGLVQVENHQPFQGTPCRNYHTVIRTIASHESNNLNEISIIGPVPRLTTLYLQLPAANSPSENQKKNGPVILGAAIYIAPNSLGKMLPSCMGLRDHQIGFSHSGKGVVFKKMYDIQFKIHVQNKSLESGTDHCTKLLYLLRFCC